MLNNPDIPELWMVVRIDHTANRNVSVFKVNVPQETAHQIVADKEKAPHQHHQTYEAHPALPGCFLGQRLYRGSDYSLTTRDPTLALG